MLGAIAGDIIGSVFEGLASWQEDRTPDFEPLFDERAHFTDDTVLTVAVAEHILTGTDLVDLFHDYFRSYPAAGYGGTFMPWAMSGSRKPYNSWGNGSAMRVSPVGRAYDDVEEVLRRAAATAKVTHNHPDGIAGAQATALAGFLARTGHTKADIQAEIETRFGYDLTTCIDDLRPDFSFDVSCPGTVPPAVRAVLDSHDFESAVRLAVSLGGDADTLACIAGGIAESLYGGVPEHIREETLDRLDDRLREVVEEFESRFPFA